MTYFKNTTPDRTGSDCRPLDKIQGSPNWATAEYDIICIAFFCGLSKTGGLGNNVYVSHNLYGMRTIHIQNIRLW